MDLSTFAGYVAAFVVALILNDWIKKSTEWLLRWLYGLGKRSLVALKRRSVILIHHIWHILPTDDHAEPLYVCLDRPCDTLFVSLQDLEPEGDLLEFDS
jgi:hypothetical protein